MVRVKQSQQTNCGTKVKVEKLIVDHHCTTGNLFCQINTLQDSLFIVTSLETHIAKSLDLNQTKPLT